MARRAGVLAVLAVLGAILVGALASFAIAQSDGQRFRADRLRGTFEIPAVSTVARGEFDAQLVNTGTGPELRYELSYSGLEGTVTQAHIHIAQSFANGGIVAWLCETAGTQSPQASFDTPCVPSGTVTGTIRPADVLPAGNPPGSQGIAAGQFDEMVAMMRAGLSYANVHTTMSPGGEIRAQIRRGGGGDGDDD